MGGRSGRSTDSARWARPCASSSSSSPLGSPHGQPRRIAITLSGAAAASFGTLDPIRRHVRLLVALRRANCLDSCMRSRVPKPRLVDAPSAWAFADAVELCPPQRHRVASSPPSRPPPGSLPGPPSRSPSRSPIGSPPNTQPGSQPGPPVIHCQEYRRDPSRDLCHDLHHPAVGVA